MTNITLDNRLNSKIFLYCDPSQSFIQKKRHIGISYYASLARR